MTSSLAHSLRSFAEAGWGRVRRYLHDAEEAAPFGHPPGTFTPWTDITPGTFDML